MAQGKLNIVAGLLFLALFMLYGFWLIWLRDFAPGKEEWIAGYTTGKHFESRLAHVHGNLFAFLNIMIGYLVLRLPIAAGSAKAVSWLGFIGMMMPLGIMAEVYLGTPPWFVMAGGIAMVASMAWLGLAVWQAKLVAV
jgi:hypothetical protein